MNRSYLFASVLFLLIAGCGDDAAPGSAPSDQVKPNALRNPSLANETAPDKFRARFRTTKGDFVIESERRWSPHGVDRLYNLIRIGYFKDTPFYRIRRNFIAQFGFHPDPAINEIWKDATIPADENIVSNFRGYLSFAAQEGRPDTRSVQLFINLNNNSFLDRQKFATVARIVEGWKTVIAKLNLEYGEKAKQPLILKDGAKYIDAEFPRMDKILSAEIIDADATE